MPSYDGVLKELEHWGSYENTARPRDISRLEGIRLLLNELGDPQNNLRVVHVAGTNGKGLTSLMLGSLIRSEGKSCGIYTSPHLTDIRERIRIKGKWIEKEDFALYAERVLDQAHSFQGKPYLSYFDLLTAVALLAFQEKGMQWVILETGLGGKADSTNVTPKELCILTPIGMDHQEVLGDSLQQIASEKMGITRPGIPTVIARQKPELMQWMRTELNQRSVPFVEAENEIDFIQNGETQTDRPFNGIWGIKWKDDTKLKLPRGQFLSLPWLECMRTAWTAFEMMFPQAIDSREENVEILSSVKLPARLEYRKNVEWNGHHFSSLVLDGGHNADALEALALQLEDWQFTNTTVILGMSGDKLQPVLIPMLEKIFRSCSLLIACPFDSQRSVKPKELLRFLHVEIGSEKLPKTRTVRGAEEALGLAAESKENPLVVCGSFYLAGEVMQLLSD